MTEQEWQTAYDNLFYDKVAEFYDRYGRYPNLQEELKLEMSITEDQIRDALNEQQV
jgi:hypothetical protein